MKKEYNAQYFEAKVQKTTKNHLGSWAYEGAKLGIGGSLCFSSISILASENPLEELGKICLISLVLGGGISIVGATVCALGGLIYDFVSPETEFKIVEIIGESEDYLVSY
ncbi:MAG: hypothetical protein SFT93_04145 [Rickettsiaceae bacterium]|nr:hypothetical protein [Rickettsiaceae bacterium]